MVLTASDPEVVPPYVRSQSNHRASTWVWRAYSLSHVECRLYTRMEFRNCEFVDEHYIT